MAAESFAWMCPYGRLCGKRHSYCPDCRGHWTSGTPHSNQPKSPRAYTEQDNWDWQDSSKRGRGARRRQQQGWTRSASARAKASKGQGKGKDKNALSEQASPFAQGTSTPWPAPETSFAFPSAFSNQTPVAPAAQPPQSTDAAYDAELIQAVKEEYPDLSKAPLRIQNAVAKAEKTTPKQLTSGLHKTSHAVGTATKELKNLRDAKVKHRERWIRHLQDSVKSWEQQLKLYNEQQTNYNNLIKKAKQDLDSARQTLEVLNKKAAGPEDQDSEVNQEEQSRLDSEATIMVQQVQEVL